MTIAVTDGALPTRYAYDPDRRRVELTVDVRPCGVDEVCVAAGPGRIALTVDRNRGPTERTVRPPSGRAFTDSREAVYNNGVLTVTVGTTRRRPD